MPSDNVSAMPEADDAERAMPAEQFAAATSDPIATARRRYGAAGAIAAAGMLGLDQALMGRKVKEEAPIVIAASDQPIDIDLLGITVPVDEAVAVVAPPQPRSQPLFSRRRRRSRR
jgi:hypothetical protein